MRKSNVMQKCANAFNQVQSFRSMFYHSIRVIVQRCMEANKVFARAFYANINEDDLYQSEIHNILQIHNINEHSNDCERDKDTKLVQPTAESILDSKYSKPKRMGNCRTENYFDVIKNDL